MSENTDEEMFRPFGISAADFLGVLSETLEADGELNASMALKTASLEIKFLDGNTELDGVEWSRFLLELSPSREDSIGRSSLLSEEVRLVIQTTASRILEHSGVALEVRCRNEP
jgi:hypothetical protein